MQTTIQDNSIQNFFYSLNNAFGSRSNFERNLITESYRLGNKGSIYLCVDKFNNFKIIQIQNNEKIEDKLFPLLKINLNNVDILNFIGDLDYYELSKSYSNLLNSF